MHIKKTLGSFAVITALFVMSGCSEEDSKKVETIVNESNNNVEKISNTINVKFTSDEGEEWIGSYNNIDLNNVDPDLLVELLTVIADRKSGNFSLKFSINEEIPPDNTTDVVDDNTTDVETGSPVDSESGVKSTGQLVAYEEDDVVMNDDGYYQSGVEIFYTRDDEQQLVTDNVTKLMWQDHEKTTSVIKYWTEPDTFQKDKYTSEGDTAVEYCNDSAFAGYGDWRLPTVKELQSTITYTEKSPATDMIFQNSQSKTYWTSTVKSNDQTQAWGIGMSKGKLASYSKDEQYNIRCVRTINK